MSSITFRPPRLTDTEQLTKLMKDLSQEETYIRLQGQQLTFDEEKEYLDGFIKDIEEKKAGHWHRLTEDYLN